MEIVVTFARPVLIDGYEIPAGQPVPLWKAMRAGLVSGDDVNAHIIPNDPVVRPSHAPPGRHTRYRTPRQEER